MRALPKAVLPLIQRFESFRSAPYRCPAGVWTVGWGSTRDQVGRPVSERTPPIDRIIGDALLFRDAAEAMRIVLAAVKVPLNDCQLSGLTVFVHNVGPGKAGVKDGFVELRRGGPSTMLRRLNEGRYDLAARQFQYWDHAKGRTLPGLVARREAERELFLLPPG